MHLAQFYVHTGIFPLSPELTACVDPLLELYFTIHPLADCFPVRSLQDSWSRSSSGSNTSTVYKHSEIGIRTARSAWTLPSGKT